MTKYLIKAEFTLEQLMFLDELIVDARTFYSVFNHLDDPVKHRALALLHAPVLNVIDAQEDFSSQ